MFYCSDCGERHSTINIVLRVVAANEVEVELCDDCVETLTGPVVGPCAVCGDSNAHQYRATELEPWHCSTCADRRRIPAIRFPMRPVPADLAAAA
ncbi:MAG: hypothetical protein QM757_26515 [Paludibaculum sp.]